MTTDQITKMMKDKDNDNILKDSLLDYVIKHRLELNVHSRTILKPNYVEPEHYDIVEIRDITTVSASTLSFTAIVSINVIIKGRIKTSYTEDKGFTWLKLDCSAQSNLSSYRIERITEIADKDYATFYSLPNITKDNIDHFAKQFLINNYPDALTFPVALPIKKITDNMGISIEKTQTEDKQYCLNGEIGLGKHFCALKFDYSRRKNAYRDTFWRYETDEKIIFFPENKEYNIFDTINHAILNILIHCEFHYKYFELIGSDIYIAPTEMPIIRSNLMADNINPVNLMEQQSLALLPRILIPTETGCQKFEELLDKLKTKFPELRSAEIMEKAIEEFAEFYRVSIQMAKQRAIDMGYDQAAGTFITVNEKKCPPVSFSNNTIHYGQTFFIDQDDAIKIIYSNNEIFEGICLGKIVYANGAFCINSSKYVYISEDGKFKLTEYALEHIDECSLIVDYDIQIEVNDYIVQSYRFYNSVKGKNDKEKLNVHNKKINPKQINKLQEMIKHDTEIKERTMKITDISNELPSDFYGAFYCLVKKAELTSNTLHDLTNISARTISNYLRYGDPDNNYFEKNSQPELGTIICICIGLQLIPELSIQLIEKGGYKLNPAIPLHAMYYQLILFHYMENIYSCNKYLKQCGYPPIPKKRADKEY